MDAHITLFLEALDLFRYLQQRLYFYFKVINL